MHKRRWGWLTIQPKVFDSFLTFEREVRAIWSAGWSYMKIMYVLTKYSAFLEAGFLIYRTLHSELPLCSPSNLTRSREDISIPGDLEWYALCEFSYKINACAYICILWGVAEADHSLQFDNQGFSLLDWVLARVSARRMLQIFILFHTSFSKVIMTTRTWAVWDKNRFLTYALPMFYVILWAGGFVIMAFFLQDLRCLCSFRLCPVLMLSIFSSRS